MRVYGLALLVLGACAPNISRFDIRNTARQSYRVHFEETEYEVPNGLKAILLRDPHVDLVEVDVRYQVGSRDDPVDKPGLAHLVEHLMFTQRVGGPKQPSLGARLRQRALSVNATTTPDATHYMTLASVDRFEELVEIEASRLVVGCETITKELLDREREVVRYELRERAQTALPEGDILAALYPAGHPYAHGPGGTEAGLNAITLADVCAFIKSYYTPGRAVLLVAGNVTADRVNAALGRYMGNIPARDAAPRRPVPTVAPRPGTVTVEANLDETVVLAAWPAPPEFSEHGHVVPIALTLLLRNIEGRNKFMGRVVEGSGALLLGGAEAPFAAAVMFVSDPGRVAWARRSLLEAADTTAFRVQGVSKGRLEKLGTDIAVALLSTFEWLGGRTMKYADWRQFRGPDSSLGPELERQSKYDDVTVRDLLTRTFDPEKITWVIVRPRQGQRATASAAAIGLRLRGTDELPVDDDEAQPVQIPQASTLLSEASRFTAKNGLEVVLLPMPGDMPMATVRLTFHAGSAHEPRGKEGLAGIAAYDLWSEAAANNFRNYSIHDTVELGTESTTYQLHGLEIHLEVMLATLGSLMEEGEYFELAHTEASMSALGRPRRLAGIAAQRLQREVLFGANHPYANAGELVPDSYARIDRFDLGDFKKRYFVGRNATLVIAGAFDAQEARTLVDRFLAGFPAGARAEALPAPRPPAAAVLGMVQDQAELLSVVLGWPAGPAADPHYPARLVAARILERRMRVVREELGASYGVDVNLVTLRSGGAYIASGNVAPLRAAEAVKAMRAQAAALRSGEHIAADFIRARQAVLDALLGRSTASPDVAEKLDWLAVHGQGPAYANELTQAVAKLTLADVRAVLATDLAPDHEVLTLGGPRVLLDQTFAAAGVRDWRIVYAP